MDGFPDRQDVIDFLERLSIRPDHFAPGKNANDLVGWFASNGWYSEDLDDIGHDDPQQRTDTRDEWLEWMATPLWYGADSGIFNPSATAGDEPDSPRGARKKRIRQKKKKKKKTSTKNKPRKSSRKKKRTRRRRPRI